MKIEVILLGKNHYDMDGNKGASVVIYGDIEETNNRAGVSISNATIDYDDHKSLNVFPARYMAKPSFISTKSRGGKDVATLKLSGLELVEHLEFIGS